MKKLIVIALIVASCGPAATQNKSKKKGKQENPKPAWLNAKPMTDQYYVGIGHGTKDGTSNYVQEAKKSALEDLVSEIKVNISSTSVLTSIDQNKEFRDKYEQMIQTTAADEIEEFESVDSWEDPVNYWVYYRLSKQRYHEIKEQQKRDAVTLALDFFTKAKESERGGNSIQALGFYYQGFRSVEKYLAEPITLTFEGKSIILTNEIYASMQGLLDNYQVTTTPSQLSLNRRVAQSNISVMAKAIDRKTKLPLGDLPLKAAFDKGSGDVFPTYKTDASGQAKILLTKIGSRDLEQTVGVSVDLLAFAGENPSPIFALISSKMTVPKASVLLSVQRPLVYISSVEKNFGVTKSNQQVTNKIKNFLTSQGFELTDEKKKAELLVDISTDSEKGAVSGSIYITYVTSVIRVSTGKENKEIYATTLERIKGYSLDYDRASQEAYNKSLDTLDKEKLPELLNAILQ
ncbi:MAG: LPP20 family lipoprotein [Cyclobacteriaceae bacterium]|nr:LPP20 family lipoprotein [Cyclobacteriaceae bacterium]